MTTVEGTNMIPAVGWLDRILRVFARCESCRIRRAVGVVAVVGEWFRVCEDCS